MKKSKPSIDERKAIYESWRLAWPVYSLRRIRELLPLLRLARDAADSTKERAKFEYAVARCLYVLERPRQSLGAVVRSIELDNSDAEAWALRSLCEAEMDRMTEALEHIEHAISLAKSYPASRRNHILPDLLLYKGCTLGEAERFSEAIACYKEGIRLYPRNPDYYELLAVNLWELDKWVESVKWLKLGSARCKAKESLRQFLASSLVKLGMCAEARDVLRKVRKTSINAKWLESVRDDIKQAMREERERSK